MKAMSSKAKTEAESLPETYNEVNYKLYVGASVDDPLSAEIIIIIHILHSLHKDLFFCSDDVTAWGPSTAKCQKTISGSTKRLCLA